MGAPKGNSFWKQRTKHGRNKIFANADLMWEAACEYFQWIEDNPLSEAIVYQGELSEKQKPLMRAMTISGMCIQWDTNEEYLSHFEKSLDLDKPENKDFVRVIKSIKQVIVTQKFEGASAGLLNPNIIARDLGLADKKELSSPDGSMTPKGVSIDPIQASKDYQAIMNAGK
tara:strand:+ start:543 stop:1055 length:513 start_codon:yes stop_codon:yes gene_type:complete